MQNDIGHAEARRQIEARVGSDAITRLRQGNRFFDLCALFGMPLLFMTNILFVGIADFGPGSLAVMFFQGIVTVWLAYIYHDVLVHRNALRGLWGRLAGIVLMLPVQYTATGYRHGHLRHHRHLSSANDTEAYKRDIDTFFKRWFFATVVGVKVCMGGGFSATKGRGYPSPFEAKDPQVMREFLQERTVLKLFSFVVLPILVLIWTKATVLGYLFPVLVVAPMFNSLRVAMEHMEMDERNPLALATCYRTGLLTRVVFFWNGGDCHLVHHLYPSIPFYRMGAAADLIGPALADAGVVQRRSFIEVMKLWFVKVHPHGTAPSTART